MECRIKNTKKLEKGYWSTIQWVWKYGKPSILLSENVGGIQITKRDGEQVSIRKINPHQSKKVMGVWQKSLLYMTKQTTELQNRIQ